MSQAVKKGPFAALTIESSKNFILTYFQKLMWCYLLATKGRLLGKFWGKTFFPMRNALDRLYRGRLLSWLGATKRKWIVLQPEVRNHLSLWYILGDNQTNRPYSFLKHAYKIQGNTNLKKLKKEKSYEWITFLKFCGLSISSEIYSSHSRISPVLRQNRKGKTETNLC